MAKNRTRQIAGDFAIKTLRSERRDERVYELVTHAAVYFASAGFLREANRLLTGLWSYGRDHTSNVWYDDRALMVLWHQAGERPEHVPFKIEPIDDIEIQHRIYMSGERSQSTPQSATNPRQALFARFLRALNAIRPLNGVMPSPEIELAAIDDMEAFNQPSLGGYVGFLLLTNIAELCARNRRVEEAKNWTLLWYETFVECWYNFNFACLPASRHVAAILLDGILAQPCGLTQQKSECLVSEMLDALAERYRGQLRTPFAEDSWRVLLERLSALAIDEEPDCFPEQTRDSRWLGFPPATATEIKAAEERLGISFPDDYREFLRTTNGFNQWSSTSTGFVQVSNVDWLPNKYPDLVDLWMGNSDVGEKMERSLLVGDSGEQLMFLAPGHSADDWECWFFANWVPGEERHASFRAFVENEVHTFEERSS